MYDPIITKRKVISIYRDKTENKIMSLGIVNKKYGKKIFENCIKLTRDERTFVIDKRY